MGAPAGSAADGERDLVHTGCGRGFDIDDTAPIPARGIGMSSAMGIQGTCHS